MRALALIAAGALALAGCGNDSGEDSVSADAPTTTDASTTTAVPTTTSSTATTVSSTTTADEFDIDPWWAEHDDDTKAGLCDAFHAIGFDALWDEAMSLRPELFEQVGETNYRELLNDECKERSVTTTATESEGFSRDAVVAIERCVGEFGSIRQFAREIGELASYGTGYDELKGACDEAALQARVDATPRSRESEVSLAVAEINLAVGMLKIQGMKDGGITEAELDEFTDTVVEQIETIEGHPQISTGWLG